MKKQSVTALLWSLLLVASTQANELIREPFSGLRSEAYLIDQYADLDGDGVTDWFDDDIDGDGIANDYEIRLGFDPHDPNSTPPDLDGDGIPDAFDNDIDGDGIANERDAFPYDPTEWADLDGDGVGDNSDPDIDGDGIANDYEIQLGYDPRDPSSTPPDLDGDGIPDALDDDIDGDGVMNAQDVFPYDATEWADLDGDGIGDNSDPDIDGDGFSNIEEERAGSDPYDANSFPDHEPPVVSLLEWQGSVLQGMAYDEGMGMAALWLQNSAGQRCNGQMEYGSRFRIECAAATASDWVLLATDRAGNQARMALPVR